MADRTWPASPETFELLEGSRVEIETPGELALRAADVEFQLGENGSIGLSAGAMQRLTAGLVMSEVVWFRPGEAVTQESETTQLEESIPLISFLEGSIVFDAAAHEARVSGKVVDFTKREYDLLMFLVRNNNKVMTRMQSYQEVWGDTIGRENDKNLDVHINRVRRKLGEYSWIVTTRRGIGHMFSCGEAVDSDPSDVTEMVIESNGASEQPKDLSGNTSIILAGGRLILDTARREIVVNDERIEPKKTEYNLLAYLVENSGVVVSIRQIIEAVWGQEHVSDNNVRVNILRVRKHLGPVSEIVRNVRGVGYIFDAREIKEAAS